MPRSLAPYAPFPDIESLQEEIRVSSVGQLKLDPRFFYDGQTNVLLTLIREEGELVLYCLFLSATGGEIEEDIEALVPADSASSGNSDIQVRDYLIASLLASRQGLGKERQHFQELAERSEIDLAGLLGSSREVEEYLP